MGEFSRLDLQAFSNEKRAVEMARYMKDLFPFLGIGMPERKKCAKELLKLSCEWDNSALASEVVHYYHLPEREYQYVAIDLLQANVKRLLWDDWKKSYFKLIDVKPWWDSVDALRKPLGLWLQKNPQRLADVVDSFIEARSIWKRRIAITVQLQFKEKTDTVLLSKSILANSSVDEFFIQKGIGWALREYSKTNPKWVAAFMKGYELSKLARREGAKYL